MLVDVVIIVCGYTEWLLASNSKQKNWLIRIMALMFNNQVEELGVLRTLRFLRIIRGLSSDSKAPFSSRPRTCLQSVADPKDGQALPGKLKSGFVRCLKCQLTI